MDILEWIHSYMAEHGIKHESEFARLAGLSKGHISKWKGGKKPSLKLMSRMAERTGTPLETIISYVEGRVPFTAPVSRASPEAAAFAARSVPVFRTDEIYAESFPDRLPVHSELYLPERFEPADEYFAAELTGNDMFPILCDGDIVIVHRQALAETGDIVIACIGRDPAFCSYLKREDEGLIFHSPYSRPVMFFISNEKMQELPLVIIGKVADIQHRHFK